MYFEGSHIVYDDHGRQMVTERDILRRHFTVLGLNTGEWIEECGTHYAKKDGMHLLTWAGMKADAALSGFVNREQVLIDIVGKDEPLLPGYERESFWRH
ncbi:hypothetical protein D7V97_30130 [Corallococcus sp. CA053C]|uniref:hypothetical protein n=1 Tax=Corallococcus sp. CA053C TaxID=2316732 RepID=UPI000EA0C0F7|nr:hypothetical protein [Corallococcus sp. CA053C]RKH00537.1 hypothetical protein D7V97_30130 [Corallococcus sp. CA053C]